MWGRRLLRTPQWQHWRCRVWEHRRNFGFFTTDVHFPDVNAIHIWIRYILLAFLFQNTSKAFFLLFQNTCKTSLSSPLSILGWSNMLLSPQLRALDLTEIGLELPDLLQSSRIRSQQGSVWQWRRSIQLCNTPILLMHFTLGRLNCFGLLIYSSSSKQKQFFPSFSLTKSFAICSKSIATFFDALLPPTSWAASKKKKKGRLSVSVSSPTKLKLKHSVQ